MINHNIEYNEIFYRLTSKEIDVKKISLQLLEYYKLIIYNNDNNEVVKENNNKNKSSKCNKLICSKNLHNELHFEKIPILMPIKHINNVNNFDIINNNMNNYDINNYKVNISIDQNKLELIGNTIIQKWFYYLNNKFSILNLYGMMLFIHYILIIPYPYIDFSMIFKYSFNQKIGHIYNSILDESEKNKIESILDIWDEHKIFSQEDLCVFALNFNYKTTTIFCGSKLNFFNKHKETKYNSNLDELIECNYNKDKSYFLCNYENINLPSEDFLNNVDSEIIKSIILSMCNICNKENINLLKENLLELNELCVNSKNNKEMLKIIIKKIKDLIKQNTSSLFNFDKFLNLINSNGFD